MPSFSEGVQQLIGALSGKTVVPSRTGGGQPNDGSARANAMERYKAASDHYATVRRATNDKKQLDDAHKELMDAASALQQFH